MLDAYIVAAKRPTIGKMMAMLDKKQFDVSIVDEYLNLFKIMQAPPANAQNSETPFKDVVDLGTAIARAKGLEPPRAEAAGLISLGLFYAETNGNVWMADGLK